MTERQARIEAGAQALWEAEYNSAPWPVVDARVQSKYRTLAEAVIDAADAIGRERVSEGTSIENWTSDDQITRLFEYFAEARIEAAMTDLPGGPLAFFEQAEFTKHQIIALLTAQPEGA